MGDRMVVGLIFCASGLFWIAMGCILIRFLKKRRSYNTEVWAKVVSVEKRRGNLYYPRYAFDFRGETYEVVSKVGNPINSWAVDDTVKVLIDENNPRDSRAVKTTALYKLWVMILPIIRIIGRILGVIYLLVGIPHFLVGVVCFLQALFV